MKRAATWLLYVTGALSIGYLAFYAYAISTRSQLTPGEPIKIFRKKDAPDYSRGFPSPLRERLPEMQSIEGG